MAIHDREEKFECRDQTWRKGRNRRKKDTYSLYIANNAYVKKEEKNRFRAGCYNGSREERGYVSNFSNNTRQSVSRVN